MKPGQRNATRHSLLQRLRDWEDASAWEDFFNTYWRLIYTLALKAGLTEQEAQDVVQETVMTVARNIKSFELDPQRGSFKSWLLTTVRWRINDQYRKRQPWNKRRATRQDSNATPFLERLPDPMSQDLETAWERDWMETLMAVATQRVKARTDPGHYQLFDLHVLRHWPAEKVARKLGVALSSVYFAKYKICRQLKKEIKQLEATLL